MHEGEPQFALGCVETCPDALAQQRRTDRETMIVAVIQNERHLIGTLP